MAKVNGALESSALSGAWVTRTADGRATCGARRKAESQALLAGNRCVLSSPCRSRTDPLDLTEETRDARAAWAAGSEARARSQQQEGVKRDAPASRSFQPLDPRFLPNHYRF